MKFIKYHLYITVSIAFIVSLGACTKKLDEVYQNPNAPVKVKPAELLPPATYQMAINLQSDFRYIGLYTQNFSYRFTWTPGSTDAGTYFDKMGYRPNVDNGGDIWRMHYYNLGQNINRMIDWAAEENKWDYVGAGYAIQAWSWLTLTDYHGEVILKEAFNINQLTFKYDTQEEVYAHVRYLCRKAIEYFEKPVSNSDFTAGDQWFLGGDINKWKKFVYGVMARSFNHLTNKADYKPDSVIYYCDKSLQTVADDVTYKFAGGAVNNQNNWYGRFRVNISPLRQSKYITNLMKGVNTPFTGVDDPRRWYLLTTAPDGITMEGYDPAKGENSLPQAKRPANFWGDPSIAPTKDTARYIFRDNAEYPIMTSSEIQFMKSEAAFRKGDKATAREAYKNAISLNFDMLIAKYNVNIRPGKGITDATKAAFLANPVVAPTEANLTLSHIMQQKFIALWAYGVLETWVDMRRYHYTDIDPNTGTQVYSGFYPPAPADLWQDNGGKLAYRVRPRYNSEYVWNIAELAKFGGDQPDYHTKEMWFSQP